MNTRRLALCILSLFAFAPSPFAADENFVPSNPPEMKPVDLAHSRANKTMAHFMRGANLGNYLEVPPGQNWRVHIAPEDFDHIKAEGFDHVRVPIGWQNYTGPGPEFKVDEEIFCKVDFVLTNALSRGLAVMLNIHNFDAFTSNTVAETDHFLAIWRQVAEHYAKLPDTVVFELLNEPKDAATTEVMNPIYARALAEIRKTNPQRTIVVGPGRWNQISELKKLILPNDDDNLIVTVHCYDPFSFTHQGASWAGPRVRVKGILFPGPPPTPLVPDPSLDLPKSALDWIDRYNTLPGTNNPSSPIAFEGELKYAHQWSQYYGRPLHVGEFGCFTTADAASRAHFYSAFRHACEEQHLGWAIWDWNAGFRYWNERQNEPMPGMRDALFGK
ncbi:MAG TPA: glycoside hydrolase family 5 protein [Verrucomicrobiae bacterium]|nr:glycoside hydrolase family 5 protein [Verrucomicrobiae bacterium]